MLKSFVYGSRKYSIAPGFTLFLFGVFAMVWFYVFNRYTILYYQEQTQLFRFDRFYFPSFLDRPGGLSEYFGAFLTQFYYYPFAGAIILVAVVTTVVLLFYKICQTPPQSSPKGRKLYSCGNIKRLFFIPFIPAILLMTSFGNVFFDLSAALGILFALAGFRWYIAMSLPVRYGAGIILVAATYFIAGGNALLLAALILIFEASLPCPLSKGEREKTLLKGNAKNSRTPLSFGEGTGERSVLYLLLLAGWTALLPWLSWRLFYTITMREAYFALTPVTFIFPKIDSKLLWLSIPALFLMWRLMANKISRWNLSPWKVGVLNFLMVAVMTVYCAYIMYDRRGNIINRITYDLQHGNFDSAIAAGKDNPFNNRLICYLTNIALYESGQMPNHMFDYKQMGTSGMLLNWEFANSDVLVFYLGEVYYRLGMMLQAEHCAFESLVSSQKGINVKVSQRLALTNIVLRDSATADKYLRYLDNSLFYRKWARQQRKNLALAMADSTFHVPGTPIPAHCKDFFIEYQVPEYTLLMLLESNPKNRMAFEYLMTYCMLERDLKKVQWCMDNYYANFNYSAIPTHYEEALLLYGIVYEKGPDFFKQYPISKTTLDRFNRYMQAVKLAQRGGERQFERFKKQFENTFWYYMNLIDPATLKK